MGLSGEAVESDRNTPRVADRVYSRLRESILVGDFEPGERIRQSEVADHFVVSHTPVREALARLASDGLVTLQPHRGAIVSHLSPSEIDEIYELRELLDPYVASRAALVASESQIAKIRKNAEAGVDAGLSPSELFETNRRFHLAIYEACGNQRMVLLFESLWNSVTAIRMFDVYAQDPDEMATMNTEHQAIAEALAARDADRSFELVKRHVSAARRDLLALLLADEQSTTDKKET